MAKFFSFNTQVLKESETYSQKAVAAKFGISLGALTVHTKHFIGISISIV